MNKLDEFEKYVLDRLNELVANSTHAAWDFLCIAALMEYIASLDSERNEKGYQYFPRFIRDHFPDKYKDFCYKNPTTKLPEQMYYILRCGLLHSFSLSPSETYRHGNDGSILISHDEPNLNPYSKPPRHDDAVILNFFELANDFRSATVEFLAKAARNDLKEAKILKYLADHPPLYPIN